MVERNTARRLSDWEREGLKKLQDEGKTQREIAGLLNMSVQTVNAQLKKINKKQKKPVIPKISEKITPEPQKTILDIDLLRIPDENTMKTDIMITFRSALAETIKRLPDMEDERVIGVVNRLLAELNKE